MYRVRVVGAGVEMGVAAAQGIKVLRLRSHLVVVADGGEERGAFVPRRSFRSCGLWCLGSFGEAKAPLLLGLFALRLPLRRGGVLLGVAVKLVRVCLGFLQISSDGWWIWVLVVVLS